MRKLTLQDVPCECSRTEAFWKEVIKALKGSDEIVELLHVGSGKKRYILKKPKTKSSRKIQAAGLIVDTWKMERHFLLFFFSLNRSFCNLASVQSIRKNVLISVSVMCSLYSHSLQT